MPLADFLYARLIAFFISGTLMVACLRTAAAEMPLLSGSELRIFFLKSLDPFSYQSRILSCVSIVIGSLLLLVLASHHEKQVLVSGVPIVGGGESQHVKKNRRRFIHDGKSMIEDGYQQVGRYAFLKEVSLLIR